MNWLDNIKIKNKLLIVFGVILCIMFFFSFFFVTQINILANNVNAIINTYQARQIHMAEAMSDLYKMRMTNLTRGYMLEDEGFIDVVIDLQGDYQRQVGSFLEHLYGFRDIMLGDPKLSEPEKQFRLDYVKDIEDELNAYYKTCQEIIAAVDDNNKERVIKLFEEAIPMGNVLEVKTTELRDVVFATTMQRASEALVSAASAKNTAYAVTSIFVLILIIASVFSVNSITKPIITLKAAVIEIANGNLAYPIRSERGDEFGLLSNNIGDMVEKISERDKLQEAIHAAEMASLAKSAFLTNMSHEIRTPMNAILGITEIQMQNESHPPALKEALGMIYSSGDLLLSIINDILDLSKIEAGKLELVYAEYDIASLINDTVTLNMMRTGSRPITFELSVDENTPVFMIGDELRIKQILNNLLSNAFKYTDKGMIRLLVSAEPGDAPVESGVTLVFQISDTGHGMTDEQVDKLFEEYSRFNIETNRMTEGTGLGMSITRNLVSMMKGTISVKSEVNWGTVFTVRLPQKTVGNDVLGRELADSLANFKFSGEKQLKRTQIVFEQMPHGRVLVVDDVESNLYVSKGLMAPYGIHAETAMSGPEAIEKIKAGNVYDIVFMDHMMPKMDGIEATKIMRSMGYNHPIVALTANAIVGQSEMFMANGFDGFISKPIDVRQLNAILKKHVREKNLPKANEPERQQKSTQEEPINEQIDEPTEGYMKGEASMLKENPELAEVFARDITKAIETLESFHGKNGVYDDEDILTYTICVHGLKNVLANIGESKLSDTAQKLEQAGRNKDLILISSGIPVLLDGLQSVLKKLQK